MSYLSDQIQQLANNVMGGTNVSVSLRKSPIELKDNSPTSSLNDDPFHFSSISYPRDVTQICKRTLYVVLCQCSEQNKI